MRLIDADKLKETIHINHYPLRGGINSIDNGMWTIGIDQAIDEQATIDAEPVRHGHWIMKQTSIGCEYTVCSSCQTDFKFKTNTGTLARLDMQGQNYCPNCGAKMDGCSDEE